MQKSKRAGFIIDCQTADLESATTFWCGALGLQVHKLPEVEAEKYAQLTDPQQRLHTEVPAVAHPSRVHLDIESDDVEAEVQRFDALGAARIGQINSWWLMSAPTGQRFCVVRSKGSEDVRKHATSWS